MEKGFLDLAEQFKMLCKAGEWELAKAVYEKAIRQAIGLSEEEKIILFGNRPYRNTSRYSEEEEIEGLFSERLVLQMEEMCLFGRLITK